MQRRCSTSPHRLAKSADARQNTRGWPPACISAIPNYRTSPRATATRSSWRTYGRARSRAMADRRGTGVPLPLPTRHANTAHPLRSPTHSSSAHPLTRSAQGARRLLREVWHDRLHELVVRNDVGRDHEHPAHSASVQRRRLGVWRVRRAAASLLVPGCVLCVSCFCRMPYPRA